jgi:hypothetical protein
MISHAIPPTICPYCGYAVDHATGISHDELVKPCEGSASICIKCAKVAIYTGELGLRKPTAEESIRIAINPRILQAQILMSGFDRERSAA